MLIVALTGGIGAGKSTVAALLEERGAEVIDVDAIGRSLLERGGEVAAAVVAEFGQGIVSRDGSVDRQALANIVFLESGALARLTSISHPAINRELVKRLETLPQASIAVLDMAVLTESNLGRADEQYRYRFVVTVEAPSVLREERAVSRGLERSDVRRRMANQASEAQRRSVADVVIVNDGPMSQLEARIDELWSQLETLAARNQ